MKIYTIGFTQSTAESFFTRLCAAGVRRLIDVRLNNVSQLAGFSKRDDLRYFLKAICGIDYMHLPSLAPTQALLDGYRKVNHDWPGYAAEFLALMKERRIEDLDPALFDGCCLLCSEAEPDHCHRRLIAEYLEERWGGLEIVHL
ncbi:MAG TPA: DUF488 domain-containing protein [Acidobacteriaceae bacterium]|nr:DUF488 domain-containing protein [Acidobacteriaceae bacterium]